ncbi:ABC transporter ATP-binding protein [Nocardia asteroides]|uniref:ABC transporter ATP-binding protein n=1 Tax=Nocardia asteroides TaxID=1824 RepID=UPI001E383D74|nr:ABC transporter ATP-binding protein [Nocardia asteroides]UGT64264.1 ABC transporter ATP-binding protein [Nocardia asteroides]
MTDTDLHKSAGTDAVSGVEIVLDSVTKRYPGSEKPAVDNVSMTLPPGEIVVLVGPSGCGKTTTMRMINRLIEPTSGKITIGGEDALRINGDQLRRKIGYAIQQSGLFPHLTVAKNIATVPGLLGWDKKRIAARVEEMLDLVGLDAATFRDRYPRQLSGGQQQRVGVARALAADPPVLLMDEPFGAVDPITRGFLQDELLRLQAELHKTIVFVTHDFAEAVKLGDRIAVLGNQSRILQYDTPEAILAAPADDTVAGFVGAGAGLRQLTLTRVSDIELHPTPAALETDDIAGLRAELARSGDSLALVLDERRRPLRWVTADQLDRAASLASVGTPVADWVARRSTLQDALEALLAEPTATAIVTGDRNEYLGTIAVDTLVSHLATVRHAAESPEHEAAKPPAGNASAADDTAKPAAGTAPEPTSAADAEAAAGDTGKPGSGTSEPS